MNGFFKSLRAEAEKCSQSNLLLLAARVRTNTHGISDKFSGQQFKQRLELGGLFLSAGSVTSMMGLAIANQQQALAPASLLANVATAMDKLGVVSVGSGVLHVPVVVALGTAVVGMAIHFGSKLLPVDREKGAEFAAALRMVDKSRLSELGSRYIGVASWLKGLKKQIFERRSEEAIADLPSAQVKQVEEMQNVDAWLKYQMADLFSADPSEARRERAAIIDELGEAMWLHHDSQIDPAQVHAALEGEQEGDSLGNVLAVDQQRGLVVLDNGDGAVTLHVLKDFSEAPKVGEFLSLTYEGGKLRHENLEQIFSDAPRH